MSLSDYLIPNLHKVFKYDCNGKYQQKDINRFISKINVMEILGPKDDCWKWTGNFIAEYGSFAIHRHGKRQSLRSSRIAYEMSTGITLLSSKQLVCHVCDNPACVNPDHFFIGTHKDNIRDMINKNRDRHLSHENHPMAKLNLQQVDTIRKLWNTGKWSQRKLAIRFNIKHTTIGGIVRNKIWVNKNYISNIHKSGNTKLTEKNVREIRLLYKTNKYTQEQLAYIFSIKKCTIGDIIRYRSWKTI